MTKRRDPRLTQKIAYGLSAVVALSMILSLIGPLLIRNAAQRPSPTPTWPPTWTPAATATPASDELVFGVFGAGRENDVKYQQFLDRVVEDGNAFLLHTGNLGVDGSESSWLAFQDSMSGFALPFYPVPGDADRDEDGALVDWITHSGAPAVHYSFDAGPAHLVIVNSAPGALGAEELAWLDADLATTRQPVKLVFTHYAPFDPDQVDRITLQGGDALMTIAKERGVKTILAGHDAGSQQATRDGIELVVSGAQSPEAPYHYVQVAVEGTEVSTRVVYLE